MTHPPHPHPAPGSACSSFGCTSRGHIKDVRKQGLKRIKLCTLAPLHLAQLKESPICWLGRGMKSHKRPMPHASTYQVLGLSRALSSLPDIGREAETLATAHQRYEHGLRQTFTFVTVRVGLNIAGHLPAWHQYRLPSARPALIRLLLAT